MSSDRLSRLEQEVHAIKGSLDWAKVLFAFLGAVTLGGFAIVFNQNGSLRTEITGVRTETIGGLASLRTDLAAEARATRAELSATTSAIANSITATKQQAPQVILVPAPATPAK